MVYFIEIDTAGNICHVMADPTATIVPLVNRITFGNKDGTPNKNSAGQDLSPNGLPLIDPIGIPVATFNTLMAGGCHNFTYDSATETVIPKVAADATKTS